MKEEKVLAKVGKIKLIFSPKDERWIMTGGTWGDHSIHPQSFIQNVLRGIGRGIVKTTGLKSRHTRNDFTKGVIE